MITHLGISRVVVDDALLDQVADSARAVPSTVAQLKRLPERAKRDLVGGETHRAREAAAALMRAYFVN